MITTYERMGKMRLGGSNDEVCFPPFVMGNFETTVGHSFDLFNTFLFLNFVLRDLVGHKVNLKMVKENPLCRI